MKTDNNKPAPTLWGTFQWAIGALLLALLCFIVASDLAADYTILMEAKLSEPEKALEIWAFLGMIAGAGGVCVTAGWAFDCAFRFFVHLSAYFDHKKQEILQ